MNKKLKTRTSFTSTLRNELFEQLKDLSDRTGVPMTRLLDRAVESYLQNQKLHK